MCIRDSLVVILRRKLLRDIWSRKGGFLAVAITIFLGLTLFAAIVRGCEEREAKEDGYGYGKKPALARPDVPEKFAAKDHYQVIPSITKSLLPGPTVSLHQYLQ